MKEQFISDNAVIVNLQNLRWVRKSNIMYGGEMFSFELCYNVKQNPVMAINYRKEKDRDSMYDRISQELTQEKSE